MDDWSGPGTIEPAPPVDSTGLPGAFALAADPSTVTLDQGAVLLGGSPLRLLRLSTRAQGLVSAWRGGGAVGQHPAAQRLARRLVASGTFGPVPAPAGLGTDDLTVVIPVRDRPTQLRRLLECLAGLDCVVVDDASADPTSTRDVALASRARYVRLDTNMGPSGARNAGLALVSRPLVAFVDSDCVPPPGWLAPLLGFFDDPMVAAVAPRIAPAPVAHPTWLSRYEAVRSSLDRGPDGGSVRPQSRLPYVPSAALVVRRAVTDGHMFDPRLRGGEDVDLVWRLARAGWDVRYCPDSVVAHDGPGGIVEWLGRRYFYGTTAAPLSDRHPEHLAPLSTSAWTAAVWLLMLRRRPVAAVAVLIASILELARRLDRTVDDPVGLATRIAGGGTVRAALPALAGLTRAWSPAAVLGLGFRRTRMVAAVALLAPAVDDWRTNPGQLDLARYSVLHVADDLAYGCGVWAGSLRGRTARPLWPRIAWRARVWSSASLRTQLATPAAEGTGAHTNAAMEEA